MTRLGYVGLALVGVLVVLALVGPALVSWEGVTAQNLQLRLAGPSFDHPLGLDHLGRDVLARIVYGARISMVVGILVVTISAVIGTTVGSISGYYGGWIDRIVSGIVFNVFLAFPGVLLAIAIVAFLESNLTNLVFALCAIGWVSYARLVRGQVLKVRELDFVLASRALGANDLRIVLRHILPNAVQPLIVQASLGMAGAVLAEATLSFLGLGVPEPMPSWGKMINESREVWFSAPHLFISPGVMIMLTVLSFNFLGDGLRDWLDPKLKRE
jgi:peptide/nickel transport system permease protein